MFTYGRQYKCTLIINKMKKNVFVIIFSLVCLTSFEQVSVNFKSTKYSISPEISQQIKKLPYSDSGTLKNSMEIEVTWDGKRFFKQKDLACYTNSYLSNDTIYIIGYMYGEIGWGFQLALFGDSCIVGSYAVSDGKVYKSDISDSMLLSFIELPCVTQKLAISKKPAFIKGERVEGFVELRSKDFYYIINETKRKASIKITAFFKTARLNKA